MRINYLQHVPFEGPGAINNWAVKRNHEIEGTPVIREVFPSHDSYDMLLILGGPMGVGDERKYSWLALEKRFIREAFDKGKTIVGICLGAQLIAEVTGGSVVPGPYREVGWHQVESSAEVGLSPVFSLLPQVFTPFHWHGEMFIPPADAIVTARSAGCPRQAFEYAEHAYGLQFHLEATPESVRSLITNCPDDLTPATYVQKPGEMIRPDAGFEDIHSLMGILLDGIVHRAGL